MESQALHNAWRTAVTLYAIHRTFHYTETSRSRCHVFITSTSQLLGGGGRGGGGGGTDPGQAIQSEDS